MTRFVYFVEGKAIKTSSNEGTKLAHGSMKTDNELR